MKLVISAGIKEVFYETPFNSGEKAALRDMFIKEGLVTIQQIKVSETIAQKAATSLLHPTSIPKCSEIREEGIGNIKEEE